MRGGFLSSFSVPGAGMRMSGDESCEAAQLVMGAARVALTLPHWRAICCCWSAVKPRTVAASVAEPATSPLS